MSDILNNEEKTKVVDLKNLYIAIYDSEKGSKIGLFEKGNVENKPNTTVYFQYYKDLLSDSQVALRLDEEGKDIQCVYQPITGDPEEMSNWKGVRETATSYDVEKYGIPSITGEIDRHINMVEYTSVYPQVQGNVSLEQVVSSLVDFCGKLNLREEAKQQIFTGLKEVPQYYAEQGKSIPVFVNVPYNELDTSNIPEDLNTIKHR